MIDILLDRGANLDNALGIAAEFHQNVDTVNFLIDKGARDTRSYALSRAACWNKVEIATALLARSSEKSDPSSTDVLQQAAEMGHLTMVDLLLDHGLDINSTDDLGQTPLGAASGANSPSCEVIQMLLRRGADVNAGTLKYPGSPYQAGDSPCKQAQSGFSNMLTPTSSTRCRLAQQSRNRRVAPSRKRRPHKPQ